MLQQSLVLFLSHLHFIACQFCRRWNRQHLGQNKVVTITLSNLIVFKNNKESTSESKIKGILWDWNKKGGRVLKYLHSLFKTIAPSRKLGTRTFYLISSEGSVFNKWDKCQVEVFRHSECITFSFPKKAEQKCAQMKLLTYVKITFSLNNLFFLPECINSVSELNVIF